MLIVSLTESLLVALTTVLEILQIILITLTVWVIMVEGCSSSSAVAKTNWSSPWIPAWIPALNGLGW